MTTKRHSSALVCGKSRTKQSFAEECDVNFIMSKWERTGVIPEALLNQSPPRYGDFSTADDYLTAVNQVLEADAEFAALPAFLRRRFDNDPAKLLVFLANSNNQDEAVKLGLVIPPKEEPPVIPAPPAVPENPPIPPNPTPVAGGE